MRRFPGNGYIYILTETAPRVGGSELNKVHAKGKELKGRKNRQKNPEKHRKA